MAFRESVFGLPKLVSGGVVHAEPMARTAAGVNKQTIAMSLRRTSLFSTPRRRSANVFFENVLFRVDREHMPVRLGALAASFPRRRAFARLEAS
jgi:hypothetical protein